MYILLWCVCPFHPFEVNDLVAVIIFTIHFSLRQGFLAMSCCLVRDTDEAS